MPTHHAAVETLHIQDTGTYTNNLGDQVEFGDWQESAVQGTRTYTPSQLRLLHAQLTPTAKPEKPTMEVTSETTQGAAHRLIQHVGLDDVMILNFASARNPGGGFLGGAKAQEEDLCRCSGLYRCLEPQTTYYEANRAQRSLLYTDHVIYSPKVVWFRTKSKTVLDEPFRASVLTAPAPNAGQIRRQNKGSLSKVEETFRRRSELVLAVAVEQRHQNLLLGAWGCGAFGNDPTMVARVFDEVLSHPLFVGKFQHITFAIYDGKRRTGNLEVFQEQFLSAH